MEDVKIILNIHLVEIDPLTDEYKAAKFEGIMQFFESTLIHSIFWLPSRGDQEKVIENIIEASELVPIKMVLETSDLDAG